MSAICAVCHGVTEIEGAVFCGHCGARLPRPVGRPVYSPSPAIAPAKQEPSADAPAGRETDAEPLPLSKRAKPNLSPTAYVYVAERRTLPTAPRDQGPSSTRGPGRAEPPPSARALRDTKREAPVARVPSPFEAGKTQLGPVIPSEPLPARGSAPAKVLKDDVVPASISEAFASVSPSSEKTPPQPSAPATQEPAAAPAPFVSPTLASALPIVQGATQNMPPSPGGGRGPLDVGATGWTPAPPAPDDSPEVSSSPISTEESLDGVLGDVLDAIDAGFDGLMDGTSTMRVEQPTAADMQSVKELFAGIAATHMRPVRDFMIELGIGDPPKEWVDVVLPAVASLRRSAEGMGLTELCVEIDGYKAVLDVIGASSEKTVTDEQRKLLVDAFGKLGAVMPEAFRLDEERDRREPIIVQSLLRQVSDVRKVALDKLYAAGLTSLEMYYVAKPYDIAEAAGLPLLLAERIVRRFARYREEISRASPDAVRSSELVQLEELAERLDEQNEEFDAASRSASREAGQTKRRLRVERNETALEINLVLARIGAVDLVKALERLAFQAKVDAVRKYIVAASREASGAPSGKKGSG